ncbi:hypothetical protein QE197_13545 [Arsenophonus nasoniae]|uniref:Uncharacterized protein n=1 Tax=Arsenophonus nasoniae TaxID=638 RepID=D2TXN9_9GAMM|nr:hypothetical protein [Arsenophonus nasoniae]QBY44515.1 hypothetical protein ArsFIN_31010 [Arsenophonus nasoniae]WGM04773.1 hypothetical protein QE258_14375 [Arsenophonus nasoniae]WGM09873.1 hypothetical protein QE197_13545 [Arsenophonus nasoniae]WGM14592.1 hypothetical protein QE193_13450 [Arsenophonus nasoniae]CBA72160.1 hypothetical protein ARN_08680 [Arsenophonus nasoniae]
MKKQQVSHILHDRQPQSLPLPSTTKLPLESDPVLKKRFESALKLAGSATPVSPLEADKNLSAVSYLLVEHSSEDAHPFSQGIKKKSTAKAEDKARHRLSIATEEIADNCDQAYDNPPYTIIAHTTATKIDNNDKLPPSSSKQKQPITHLANPPTDKAGRNKPLKAPLSANTLSANPITNQPINQ